MAERTLKKEASSTDNNQTNPSYIVGYKKPPLHTQFQKGKSGNKKGRPKGAKNKSKDLSSTLLSDLILEEAYREITVNEGDKTLNIPIIKAALRSLAMNAAKGKYNSLRLLLRLVGETETARETQKFANLEDAIEYKEKKNFELEQAKKWDQPIPDPLPHPEHVVINPRTGEAKVIGPASREEKMEWDLWFTRKFYWQELREDLVKILERGYELSDDTRFTAKTRKIYLEDIEQIECLINLARKLIPDDMYIAPSTEEFCRSNPFTNLADSVKGLE